jgi:CspA family cold shock protein
VSGVARGRIRWFSVEKGYGFIEDEGDEALLLYYTEIGGEGFRTLEEGGEVVFEVAGGEDERKQATRVETVA